MKVSCELERIVALALPENIGSRRVMEHIGLRYEKDAHFFNLDVVYYAITWDEFRSVGSLSDGSQDR